MAPAFYHYLPLPMDEVWKDKNFRVPRLLCLIGVLGLLVVMAVTLGYFAVKANSEPCQDGLRAEQRCHNVSHHLQAQLTRAQKTLRDADAACNSTVENLNAALTEMKTQEQKQQKQVQDLKDEIKDLKQKLQKAEEEAQQLRSETQLSRATPPAPPPSKPQNPLTPEHPHGPGGKLRPGEGGTAAGSEGRAAGLGGLWPRAPGRKSSGQEGVVSLSPEGWPSSPPSSSQSLLQAQLKALDTEMDKAKARAARLGVENGALAARRALTTEPQLQFSQGRSSPHGRWAPEGSPLSPCRVRCRGLAVGFWKSALPCRAAHTQTHAHGHTCVPTVTVGSTAKGQTCSGLTHRLELPLLWLQHPSASPSFSWHSARHGPKRKGPGAAPSGSHKGAGEDAATRQRDRAAMGLAVQPGAPYARAGGSERGCWFYLRYLFLFASLVQTLIIVGLVLFMVYGNVHQGTEANLQDTERRAAALHGQVVELTAARANLTRELNLTARAKDSIMQMLLGARRDLEGINASFRQCQADQREAAQLEVQLRAECTRQTNLVQEEKAALRKEQEALAKELDERRRQVEQMQMQVEVKSSALDTCVKAKSQPQTPPRPGLAPPNPPTIIDSASLEEFKKRILESQQPFVLRPAK
ncbi:Plasmalemma vesicle-associated protein [Heterocephalus glaber]|uniref:Plasmalemma vesicle-associated protein n=1 Tax=Heterocephalus glaber TaxID=10181 RepID=G5B7V8_HETGA|nr:Plasmalemma vesicle-associated protein [Heterocephalus glaber]